MAPVLARVKVRISGLPLLLKMANIASTTSKTVRWKDGREFSASVQVCSADLTRHLFRTHARRAMKLCTSGSAVPAIEPTDTKIWRIVIIRVPGPLQGDPSPLTPACYDAKCFTLLKERVGDPKCWDGLKTYTHLPPTRAEQSGQRAVIRDCKRIPI